MTRRSFSPLNHPLAWLAALALAHVAVRVAISPALKWDEAEQMLWSQQLAWGYGPQPPLYTWLQWGVNALLGPSVLSLSVLKLGLLALVYVLMYRAARELLEPRGAWWAAASMTLLPPLGWDSLRDQTHTVLVTAAVCAAWWLLLRLARRPRPADFAWLGVVCAAGMLAKYSFALFLAAALAAALSVPEVRRALLSRGWWLAPLIAAALLLPHALWLLDHLREATNETLQKMNVYAPQPWWKGPLSLVQGLFSLFALWAALALWAFRGAWWRAPLEPASPAWQRVFTRYLLLIGLALAALVLAGGVSHFKGRWLLPLLCVVPLAAFAARPELQRHVRASRYAAGVWAAALLILLAAALRPWVGGMRGDVDELNHPAAALARALRGAGYDGRGVIVAADHMLAGMLRTRFPEAAVRSCERARDAVAPCIDAALAHAARTKGGWLLVSRDDRLDAGWWAEVQARLPPKARSGAITLPLRMVRAGTPPARYQYALPAAPARTP